MEMDTFQQGRSKLRHNPPLAQESVVVTQHQLHLGHQLLKVIWEFVLQLQYRLQYRHKEGTLFFPAK